MAVHADKPAVLCLASAATSIVCIKQAMRTILAIVTHPCFSGCKKQHLLEQETNVPLV